PGMSLVCRREAAEPRRLGQLPVRPARYACTLAILLAACGRDEYRAATSTAPPVRELASLTATAERIAATSARSPDTAWERWPELGDVYGPRITGSPALEQAIAWAPRQMGHDGLDDGHP